MIEAVKQYYDDLAPTYDGNRFENSYGKFIHEQERTFLEPILSRKTKAKVLDLGCGTGRFLEFANHGVDLSPKMIEVAQSKFPNTEIREGSVSSIPFDNDYFDIIYSLHVIMHLDSKITADFLTESYKKTNQNGLLIFDFPSKKRRKLVNYKPQNWHAANHFSVDELLKLNRNRWKLKSYRGILFLPIHRFPSWIRPIFISMDNFLCKSLLKEYASYLIVELEKK
jgi:ubiquinone/menaquinone biosynthesis C-methylase UbiE